MARYVDLGVLTIDLDEDYLPGSVAAEVKRSYLELEDAKASIKALTGMTLEEIDEYMLRHGVKA